MSVAPVGQQYHAVWPDVLHLSDNNNMLKKNRKPDCVSAAQPVGQQ